MSQYGAWLRGSVPHMDPGGTVCGHVLWSRAGRTTRCSGWSDWNHPEIGMVRYGSGWFGTVAAERRVDGRRLMVESEGMAQYREWLRAAEVGSGGDRQRELQRGVRVEI